MIGKMVTFALCTVVSYAGWRYVTRHPVEHFETQRVERGDLQAKVTATGSCSARETIEVGAQVSGLIKAVYADFNTPVHRGQILALIDPGPYEVQLTEAKASYEGAQAASTAARAALAEAKTNIDVAREMLAGQQKLANVAETAEMFAKVELGRAQRSADADITSQDDLQTATTNFSLAKDDLDVAKGQVDTAALSILEKEAEADQASASLNAAIADAQRAEIAVQLAQVNLSHTEITAPIDGIVLNRNINAGETVASSAVAPILFELVKNLDKMRVDVNLDEADVGQVKAGELASFKVDAFPGRTFQAIVNQVRHEATNIQNVISYDVVLDVLNPDVPLLPGMTANTVIQTAKREGVIKIPNGAFRYRPAGDQAKPGSAVYVLGEDNRPHSHPIKTGISDGRFTEMLTGDLEEGAPLITASGE
ncbi:MAG: efflux RND transporter periplasmic adaptor subunit [Bryobacteraceae bacterium]